jgi:hypothetical protein
MAMYRRFICDAVMNMMVSIEGARGLREMTVMRQELDSEG